MARIEATDTTRWFGFKDDVVIRLQTVEEGVRLEMRSKSRLGRGDVRTNAERIRTFIDALPLVLNDCYQSTSAAFCILAGAVTMPNQTSQRPDAMSQTD